MSARQSAPWIYINGYPGVGKLTVAHELQSLIPGSKVLDNHSLIDVTSKIYTRDMPEYQPLRQAIRRTVLESISQSKSTEDVVWIFTDQQSSGPLGSAAVNDYRQAAAGRGATFISIILSCELDENLRRLSGSRRGESNSELIDATILQHIRETEDIFHHGGEFELEINVTSKSAHEVAAEVKSFVDASLR